MAKTTPTINKLLAMATLAGKDLLTQEEAQQLGLLAAAQSYADATGALVRITIHMPGAVQFQAWAMPREAKETNP